MVSRRFALTAMGFVLLAVSSPTAAPDFSDWSAPVNLGPNVNSAFGDTAPAVSKDQLSLYFSSTRPDGLGGNDIWVSQRNSVGESWGPPTNLGPVVNTIFGDFQPSLSRDGHWLFFTSGRPGFGSGDIWVSYRAIVRDDFGWQPPVNAGSGINSPGNEQNPNFFENDDVGVPQLFFSNATDGIYVSDLLPDGTFGPARPVVELDSTALDRSPSVRFDGLEVFFQSNRPGSFGLLNLWTATRDTVSDAWSEPTNLGPLVNSLAIDGDPEITSDRETLYFVSNRTGGVGGFDLYVTTRAKHTK